VEDSSPQNLQIFDQFAVGVVLVAIHPFSGIKNEISLLQYSYAFSVAAK
jgi:hypothetical protein